MLKHPEVWQCLGGCTGFIVRIGTSGSVARGARPELHSDFHEIESKHITQILNIKYWILNIEYMQIWHIWRHHFETLRRGMRPWPLLKLCRKRFATNTFFEWSHGGGAWHGLGTLRFQTSWNLSWLLKPGSINSNCSKVDTFETVVICILQGRSCVANYFIKGFNISQNTLLLDWFNRAQLPKRVMLVC